jgi:hypothetical protein
MKKIMTVLLLLIPLVMYAPDDAGDRCDRKGVEDMLKRIERIDLEHRILSTIRFIESRDNYQAVGGSGEYGAYQWLPSSWAYYSLKFYGEVLDITIPANQDSLSLYKVRWLLDKGYTPNQIASFWNSGSKEWRGRTGFNRHGIRYDVPGYVKKFNKIFNT